MFRTKSDPDPTMLLNLNPDPNPVNLSPDPQLYFIVFAKEKHVFVLSVFFSEGRVCFSTFKVLLLHLTIWPYFTTQKNYFEINCIQLRARRICNTLPYCVQILICFNCTNTVNNHANYLLLYLQSLREINFRPR